MNMQADEASAPEGGARILVDAGGSWTRIRFCEERYQTAGSGRLGLAPPDSSLVRGLRDLPDALPRDAPLWIAASGASDPERRLAALREVRSLGFTGPVGITPDLHAGLFAEDHERVLLVVCGTGSVVGLRDGHTLLRTGGWGPLLGDPGSGLELGRLAARRMAARLEGRAPLGEEWRDLLHRLTPGAPEETDDLRRLRLLAREPEGLARLAELLLGEVEGSTELEPEVASLLDRLAEQAARVVARRWPEGPPADLVVRATGGLVNSSVYRELLGRALEGRGLPAPETLSEEERFRGLACLAELSEAGQEVSETLRVGAVEAVSPTELDNPFSQHLDQLDARAITDLMLSESRRQVWACQLESEALARAVELAAAALEAGGRVLYVGAGTSGRLGVLDASESPPTFHVDPSRIRGFLAGGRRAAFEAVEGAEDSAEDGAAALDGAGLEARDLVVGIAASGTTPYVLGALDRARELGAPTVLVSNHPRSPARDRADVFLGLPTGPEVLRGSTRLNAGGSAKLVLNILTTGAWVLRGKCYGNYMVDLRQTSSKLVRRARRILRELAGDLDPAETESLLEAAGGRVKTALLMQLEDLDREEAEARLERSGGHLREWIGPPRRSL